MASDNDMGFLDHLEELRWRIIKAVIGVVLGAVVVGVFIDWIMDSIIFAPAKNTVPPLSIINLKPYGQFILYMQVILIGGAVLSVPNIIYQFWKFVEPALKPGERKYVTAVVLFTTFCFLAGVVFAYFAMVPAALGFFAGFGSSIIENKIAADEYMSFILSLVLAAGLVFELPMLSFFLSKIGILKPAFMRKYRKHAVVAILLLAGIVTPGPDITSQLMLGIPLFILYEISILICKYSQKKT
ncbi:MAG: twin-arginine translocase subunit TatC [Ignavibacteriae bacterium]|jgi:sec-independent protein translocase protein TatC|nr:twin-arginine translocase subunit TatC [Ignavibacteriota bacterium]